MLALDFVLHQELVIFRFAILECLVKSSITSIKVSLYSLQVAVKVVIIAQSIVSSWQYLNFSSSSCLLSFWSSNSFLVAVPGQDSHRCMMHLLLSVLQTISLIRSFYVKSPSTASTSNTTFWWPLQTQTEWVIFEPARTHHLDLKAQNFENPIFTFGCFSLKAIYNSCKSQRLLPATKFLTMYSFTHTNMVFLFRHLPTEIFIFINFCYQMKCLSDDSFSFLEAIFANIPPTFLILCEVRTRYSKTLKYSEQYIRDHLPGTKVRFWIYSEYHAVFNFSCIAVCNLTKLFAFFFI